MPAKMRLVKTQSDSAMKKPSTDDQLFRRPGVVRDKDRDAALVSDCLQGDRGAMNSLVAHYEKPVFNAAYRILGNAEDAADVSQTAFMKAFENLHKFSPKFKFFSWIYKITVNEAISTLKRRKNPESLVPEDASIPRNPEQVLHSTELSSGVQAALMTLPEEQRILVVLKHFSELSYRDISAIMDIPEKTVKSRLYSARQTMKKDLKAKGFKPE